MAQNITKDTSVSDVLKKYPKTIAIFMNYGLHCVGCPMAPSETIGEIAKLHQADLKKLLDDLNRAAKS